MEIPFIKCHGSGNDFILIDEIKNPLSLSEKQRKDISRLLCDREHGIGSDGVLFVLPSEKAEAQMRMFNSDGTEAEMCGNGLRCVARHMIDALGEKEIAIETKEAVLDVSQVKEIFPGVDTFAVAIEPVSFAPSSLPMNVKDKEAIDVSIPELSTNRTFTALSVPNPHVVSIVDHIDQRELKIAGQKANAIPELFPRGVNVSFVKVMDSNKIFVQTYERGVGLTNACGTAMSASSLVSTILGPNEVGVPIVVMNKGGLVNCVVEKKDEGFRIQLRGNGTNVYESKVTVNSECTEFELHEKHFFTDENEKYEKLKEYASSQVRSESI
ncbi:diaminopimelate epimerase [Halobacillus yeomjeoni]|uniref:diaminopimelate epimerase n=1 Tax=Halobacillus yeomjeoni TaxID=311194 RepID=UPI001CD2B897|nr:diaminopimelate epimerase [Halobacillus yeomjeoni]MCA0983749.1 diaminopimelate epimerase [Halobacillus yeomjeoni]